METEDKLEWAERLISILVEPLEMIEGRWADVPADCMSEEHKVLRCALQAFYNWEADQE